MINSTKILKATPLPRTFYRQPTLKIANELLGKYLVRKWSDSFIIGKIVETEAYIGEEDPACHAARGKTDRNGVMYGQPGFAYIYFIYGMYFCLNVVTGEKGFPAAILIRAVEPFSGIELMKKFRKTDLERNLTNGPGKLCQAFGLNREQNGADLCGKELFISSGEIIKRKDIARSKRIGIKVGIDPLWRFFVQNNVYVSKGGKSLGKK